MHCWVLWVERCPTKAPVLKLQPPVLPNDTLGAGLSQRRSVRTRPRWSRAGPESITTGVTIATGRWDARTWRASRVRMKADLGRHQPDEPQTARRAPEAGRSPPPRRKRPGPHPARGRPPRAAHARCRRWSPWRRPSRLTPGMTASPFTNFSTVGLPLKDNSYIL